MSESDLLQPLEPLPAIPQDISLIMHPAPEEVVHALAGTSGTSTQKKVT